MSTATAPNLTPARRKRLGKKLAQAMAEQGFSVYTLDPEQPYRLHALLAGEESDPRYRAGVCYRLGITSAVEVGGDAEPHLERLARHDPTKTPTYFDPDAPRQANLREGVVELVTVDGRDGQEVKRERVDALPIDEIGGEL